jgi:pre-mRNA-splicing factor SYF2
MPSLLFIDRYSSSIDKRRKFSRKRPNEDTGDITYINEKNRIFNKKVESSLALVVVRLLTPISKIARYFDKYTAEIRASFERGTAL